MLCNETLILTSNAWFWGSKVIKFTGAPLAIFFNIALVLALRKCSSVHLHANLYYLLTNLSLCSVVASGYLLVKGFYTVALYWTNQTCKLQASFATCKYQETVFICCKLSILGTMLCLGVERLYAIARIKFCRHYNEEKPFLAVVGLSLTWIFSLICTLILAKTVPDGVVAYCNALFIYSKRVLAVLSLIILPLDLCCLVSYVSLYFVVLRKWRPAFAAGGDCETYTLNSRFEKKIVVAVTKAMLPSSVLHAICWTIILTVSAMQIFFHNFSVWNLLVSQYLFYILWLMHMVLHPIFILSYCHFIRHHFCTIFRPMTTRWTWRRRSEQDDDDQENDDYATEKRRILSVAVEKPKLQQEWQVKGADSDKIKEQYFEMLNDSWGVVQTADEPKAGSRIRL
uniref:G-protein coupled receptors family 1 profile domain-containing protein n=1 Tax=Romanomermis culicivorax TaxID=13658 RepID=A0A915JWR7_ROMCU